MAETKHTPGPWKLMRLESEQHEEIAAYQAGCTAKGKGPFFIVLCEKPDGPADVAHTGNGPTSGWNGALIAAAPELLEALKAVDAAWSTDEDVDFPVAQVRAAIAKAEGR